MLTIGLLIAVPFAMPAATGCDPSWNRSACGIARGLVLGMHVLAGVLLVLHVAGRIVFDARLREVRDAFRAWRAGPSPETLRRRRAAVRRPSLVAAAWGRPIGPAPAEPRHPLLRQWRSQGLLDPVPGPPDPDGEPRFTVPAQRLAPPPGAGLHARGQAGEHRDEDRRALLPDAVDR